MRVLVLPRPRRPRQPRHLLPQFLDLQLLLHGLLRQSLDLQLPLLHAILQLSSLLLDLQLLLVHAILQLSTLLRQSGQLSFQGCDLQEEKAVSRKRRCCYR